MMAGGLISWQQPAWLLLLLPTVLCLGLLWQRQRAALSWLEENTTPRRRAEWTRHTQGSLLRHFGLLLAAAVLLTLAAAGPTSIGTVTARFEDRSIVLLIDASLSMAARDVPAQVVRGVQREAGMGLPADDVANGGDGTGDDEAMSRLQAAQEIAQALLHAEPKARFALVTFSGAAVVHSPPTYDHLGLESLLRTLRLHVDVPTSGTRFSSAFEAAARLVASRDEPVDVVLLSDGELPEEDAVDEGLRLLELRGTPVHAVGLGGTDPVGLNAYRLDDILWNEEENRVATSFETSRVDEELRRVTERTRSSFVVPQEGDDIAPLLGSLSSDARGRGTEVEGERDLAWIPLFLFVLLFLHEALWLANRDRRRWIDGVRESADGVATTAWPLGATAGSNPTGNLAGRRSGSPSGRGKVALAFAPFLLLAECPEPFGTGFRAAGAATFNEVGRDHADNENWMAAQLAFRHAVALGWRPHVSRTNLATVQLETPPDDGPEQSGPEQGEPSVELRVGPRVAHETFERVLEQHARYRPAQHGDGLALFRWGQEELDIEQCETERTRVLWEQALGRFESAGRFAFWFTKGRQVARLARSNRDALRDELAQLDEIDEQCQESPPSEPPPEPPPDPEQSPESPQDPESESGGGGGGGGDGEDPDENQGEGGQGEGSGGGQGEGGGESEGEGEGAPESDGNDESPQGGDGENDQGTGGGGDLSDDEREQIASALERIRQDSQGARGYHQLGRSQVNPGNARAGQGLVRKW